ncbi:MAG: radical SAM family heme chaperone HemW [Bacillaceae bacterium]
MVRSAYIHIPFCQQICHYCDFNKFLMERQPVEKYITYVEKEMKATLVKTPTTNLETIFVGGGTPTALGMNETEKLLQIIQTQLQSKGNITEYTFEGNPCDITYEKAKLLHDYGVNRLSIGVQTFNNDLLKKIGRTHEAKDAFIAVENAKKAGFTNINVDLIYALPNQTYEDVQETLQQAFTLDIPHYSAYSLIVEPKTVFYTLANKGKLALPLQEEEARMYELVMDEMEKHGHHQYEISNFSKSGFESKHNLTYWNNEEYYGFGAGAHSYVAECRNGNHGPLKKYFHALDQQELPYLSQHKVTMVEKIEEELFLGLRKTKGVNKVQFEQKYGHSLTSLFASQLVDVKEKGLLAEDDERIFLTRQGKLLGNEVFQTFLAVLDEV